MADRLTRSLALGVTAAACVLAIALTGLARVDEALGLLDWRADENAALPYLKRVYGDRGWARDPDVVEQARMLMPADAVYTVVYPRAGGSAEGDVLREFLKYYLLPRRLDDSGEARWAFCFRCATDGLGADIVPLFEGADGDLVFGRVDR